MSTRALSPVSRLPLAVLATAFCLANATATRAQELPIVRVVEQQPLVSATERLLEALKFVGAPLAADEEKALQEAMKTVDADACIKGIQKVLDKHCLAGVNINPESRVKVVEGPVTKELVHNGWRTFLVKVHNEAGINPKLIPESPNAAPQFKRSSNSPSPKAEITLADAQQRWLDIAMFDSQPLKPTLSGLGLEYRIIQLYSRDVGRREAKIGFNVGQGTQDLGFREAVPVLFNAVPSVEVSLGVKDFDGAPITAAFVIRDKYGRIYPNPARRFAPDFFFHNQIYRADGESVHLPPGEFTVTVSRGPEYQVDTHKLEVKPGVVSQKAEFSLRRWIQAAKRNWYSGDHHVHAAGCSHYDNPTEGVTPADMMRHILGEDLNVGCVLSWGPCWYTQKQYFEGKTSALSKPNYLMRYDVEVSGFPSSHAGHLCLLKLSEDDYPGTRQIEEWPSWTLPVLKWGKDQGGVVGYSHSGWGLTLPDHMPDGSRQFLEKPYGGAPAGWTGKAPDKLPDYAMPKFDGIGANEYIVTTALDTCHFISAVDTPSIWELNIWYHTLNCGMTTRISGETDFPCIYGDKVGLGRIYVKLKPEQKLDFDTWILGVKDGRSYCGDGLSHLFDFKVNDVGVGEPGSNGKLSQVDLASPGKVKVSFDVAALLAEQPNEETERIRKTRLDQKPYWHLERSRLGNTRTVPVEVIVNGYPAATKNIVADGSTQPMTFDIDIPHSSWVAVRILPSAHTNPVWVEVGGKPVRASKRSAEWCVKAVETCWNSKKERIREAERETAKAAYDKATAIYQKVLGEAVAE
jgi:hypothetical protein